MSSSIYNRTHKSSYIIVHHTIKEYEIIYNAYIFGDISEKKKRY